MSTHGQTETSMSQSSERTYSKVKWHFRLFHLAFGWMAIFLTGLVQNSAVRWDGGEIFLVFA